MKKLFNHGAFMKKMIVMLLIVSSVLHANLGEGFGGLFQVFVSCWHTKKKQKKPITPHDSFDYSNTIPQYQPSLKTKQKEKDPHQANKKQVRFLLENDQQ